MKHQPTIISQRAHFTDFIFPALETTIVAVRKAETVYNSLEQCQHVQNENA